MEDLVGIQAYRQGDYRYGIDYTMKTTAIVTLYVNKHVWRAILSGLTKLKLI